MMEGIIKNAQENQRKKDSYRDENGLLRCHVCGQPLEAFIKVLDKVMPTACDCDRREEEARALAERLAEAEQKARDSPFYDPAYNSYVFEQDTSPDSSASRQCRAYVEHWAEMEAENFGLLFSGPLGTGKTYFAAAIVNALRAKGVSTMIVSTSRLINVVRSSRDPQAAVDDLNKFQLVALDDLGAERDTSYAVEQLENFIDWRSRRGKPLIATTNLLRKDLDAPENIAYSRVFDRVKVMCCRPIILTGPSKRVDQARERAERCKRILGI